LDHHGRAGRHVADEQGPMRDASAEFGLCHVLLVDVVDREISGDAGKHIDIGLAHRLRERDAVADLDEEFFRRCRIHAPPFGCTYTTPSRASEEISAAPNPSSTSTSSVCAPSGCGGRRTLAAFPSYRTGWFTSLTGAPVSPAPSTVISACMC